ncbi:hypothetical protein [Helicobacter rodentium]|nr:hypothetical protein [Helicobacter rodentium]
MNIFLQYKLFELVIETGYHLGHFLDCIFEFYLELTNIESP